MAKKVKKSVVRKSKFNFKIITIAVIAVIIVLAIVYLSVGAFGKPSAQLNDNVKVDYVGSLADGTVFDTSIKDVAATAGINRTDFQPLEFVLGEGSLLPGFENAVIGMQVGQTKSVTLNPDQAYGEVKQELIINVPREQKIDRYLIVNLSEFKSLFGADPILNQNLTDLGLSWDIQVIGVNDTSVKAENLMTVGQNIQMPGAGWYSSVEKIDDAKIYLKQNPILGDVLALPTGLSVMRGTVTEVNDANFTVDMNHPLAGKILTFKITLVDLNQTK